MTHCSIFDGDTLTLTSPRGKIVLSQGQCAAIVIMADKHGPVGGPVAGMKCDGCDTTLPRAHPFTVCDACWEKDRRPAPVAAAQPTHAFASDSEGNADCADCGHGVADHIHGDDLPEVTAGGAAAQPEPCNHPASCTRDGCEICNQCHTMLHWSPPADQPAGDDAAVEQLARIILREIGPELGWTDEDEWGDCPLPDAARAVLAAIRRGEVPIPGYIREDVWQATEREVDRLTDSLRLMAEQSAGYMAERDEARQAILELQADTSAEAERDAVEPHAVRIERIASAPKRAVKAKVDRDAAWLRAICTIECTLFKHMSDSDRRRMHRLAAQVERLQQAHTDRMDECGKKEARIRTLTAQVAELAERDKALQEVLASMDAQRHRANNERDKALADLAAAEDEIAAIEHAIPDDDDMRTNAECVELVYAERDSLAGQVVELTRDVKNEEQATDAEHAFLIEARGERDKALADLAVERGQLRLAQKWLGETGVERDAARAEAARWHEASKIDRSAADNARAEADACRKTIETVISIFFRSGLVDDRALIKEATRVKAEADALRKEVAVLRADRSVIDAWNNNQKIEYRLRGTESWHACDDPMWCYKTHEYRIRAAGIEVGE